MLCSLCITIIARDQVGCTITLAIVNAQMFKLLGLKTSGEGSVSRETVTLANFLDVADKVVSKCWKSACQMQGCHHPSRCM